MRTLFLSITACLLINTTAFLSCKATSKTSNTDKNYTTATEISSNSLQEKENQSENSTINPCSSKYGADSAKCIENLSLYREYYKQKNYADAYEPWKWCLMNCPCSSENLYIDGATLVKTKINKYGKEPAVRDALIDTLMFMYDLRITYFGKEGFVTGKKAADLFALKPSKSEEIYNFSKKTIELMENKTEAAVLIAYLKSAVSLVEAKKATAEIIVDAYLKTSEIADWNMKNNIKDTAYFRPAQANIEIIFDPFATCPDLIKAFTPKYQANPNDIELLTKITKMLNKKNCTDEELFFKATENLHKLAPTAQSAYMMGKMSNNKKMYAKAQEYFLQAVELYTDTNDKADTYLVLADLCFKNLNQYSAARSYAYKAAALRPNDGKPYILIGDLYASSSGICVSDDSKKDIEAKAPYWAAVDKYYKAKAVDSSPEIINVANQKIAAYTRAFPNNEIIFFHGLTEGQSYNVGCWINESTTVRASK